MVTATEKLNLERAARAEKRQRSILYRSKTRRVMSALMRNKRFQLRSVKGKSLLNLGCGGNILHDFIGLDINWWPGLTLCWDLRKGIPLPDSSLDGVYTEHALEHIPYDLIVKSVLPEIRRILKPGATLRICVPDGEKFIDMYQRVREGLPAWPDSPTVIYTPMWHINRIARYQGHQFLWDYDTFELVLREAGFTDIQKCGFMQGRDSRLLVDMERRRTESLYVEAAV